MPAPTSAEFTQPLNAAVDTLDELTAWLLDRAQGNPNEIGAASVEYLHVFGYTAYAYLWARMAKAADEHADATDDFYASKLATARFYFARLLPRIHSLSASAKAGSECLFAAASRAVRRSQAAFKAKPGERAGVFCFSRKIRKEPLAGSVALSIMILDGYIIT